MVSDCVSNSGTGVGPKLSNSIHFICGEVTPEKC